MKTLAALIAVTGAGCRCVAGEKAEDARCEGEPRQQDVPKCRTLAVVRASIPNELAQAHLA